MSLDSIQNKQTQGSNTYQVWIRENVAILNMPMSHSTLDSRQRCVVCFGVCLSTSGFVHALGSWLATAVLVVVALGSHGHSRTDNSWEMLSDISISAAAPPRLAVDWFRLYC
ncbi:hypothetical protein RRG08_040772 [Elysia crispata]|uniref:Uncharacterized protein n=1 Tax=Elysia crispata TaxID=231223 RepID=A0AAE1BE92_9GAST|nr:hypothetical protein RRG08_040772 [Elysia crispata]